MPCNWYSMSIRYKKKDTKIFLLVIFFQFIVVSLPQIST